MLARGTDCSMTRIDSFDNILATISWYWKASFPQESYFETGVPER